MSRGTSLRSRLSRRLVGLGLVSVVLLATVNFVVVRTLLDSGAENQLMSLSELRQDAIETGVDRLLERVAVIAADPGVARALSDLDAGYRAYTSELSPTQIDELAEVYAPVVQVYDDAGVDRPEIEELLPDIRRRSVGPVRIHREQSVPGERAVRAR